MMSDGEGESGRPFSLPVGTVTFLLTDIEGSSRAWEADGSQMAADVARHYEILDAAVVTWGGVRPVEQGEGDSVVAAFSRASDAVGAALDAQLRLHRELEGRLRVRMALHTGEAQLRDEGNYFGQTVIRCARLRSCGHGGQILLSHTAADLVTDRLQEDATLLDLGEHRLKDLSRRERILELCHPDLPSAGRFPPLRSLDAFQHNLPTQLTPLIGREREMAEVTAMVKRERVVSLTGTGGCGKSRLAGEVAARLVDRFPGGVWWCELAPQRDGTAVIDALAASLGVVESPGRPLAAEVADRLRASGPALVVLDNAEHLLDAVARSTVELVDAVPDLHMVVTSREPLSVPGEVAWRVPSLATPPDDIPLQVDQVDDYEAVGLFVERAARARRGFALTEENAAAVGAICCRLDGIPLAIELAAARVRTMPPERIAAQLDDRFRLLTGGARTLLPRQQTLLASVSWSEALLDDTERVALRRLGVFVGGFSLEFVEVVLGAFDDIDAYEVLDIIGRLVDKSLLVLDDDMGRYRMLETIRSYSLARLLDAGEGDAARDAHLTWAISRANELTATFSRSTEWYRAGEIDWPNFAAALDWAHDRPEERCALVAGLGGFWLFGQRHTDALRYGRETIWRFAEDPPPSWYRAIANTGPVLHNALGADMTSSMLAKAEEMAQEAGDGTAGVRIAFRCCMNQLERDGLTDEVLSWVRELHDRSVALDDRLTGFNAALLPFQFLTWSGRLDEASEWADLPVLRDQERWSRLRVVDAYRALNAGDLALAAEHAAQAVERAADVPMVERFTSLATAELVDLLRVGAHGAAGMPAVLPGDSFTGLWAVSHAAARARRAVRTQDWGELRAVAALELETASLNWMRFEATITPALVAAGDVDQARTRATALLDRARRTRMPLQAIEAHHVLAEIDGNIDHAFDALSLSLQLGLVLLQIDGLELIAANAVRAGDLERAARLKGSAIAARDETGYRFRWPSRQAAFDAIPVPAGMTADPLNDACVFALRGRGERRRPTHGWAALTPTEQDVARRVATGLTNPQVAKELHVTPATIKTHLEHIYVKLGINSRAELAVWVTKETIAT